MTKSGFDVSGVLASSISLSFSYISSIVLSMSNEFLDVVEICREIDLGVMDCRLYSEVIKKVVEVFNGKSCKFSSNLYVQKGSTDSVGLRQGSFCERVNTRN